MALTLDYSDVAEGGGIIPEGDYECIIKWAGEDATTKGTVYLGVTLVIRNDINQQYKNKYLFYKIWHKKEPSPADLKLGGYSSKQINKLSKSAGIPMDMKLESFADWGDALQNKVILATVEHEDYNGKPREKVSWINESKYPQCNHRWKNADVDVSADDIPDSQYATPTQQGFEEVPIIADDDLPF